MKTRRVDIAMFEKGDRVFTPEGKGTVVYDSVKELNDGIFYQESERSITIQLDEGNSNNSRNVPVDMEPEHVSLLYEE